MRFYEKWIVDNFRRDMITSVVILNLILSSLFIAFGATITVCIMVLVSGHATINERVLLWIGKVTLLIFPTVLLINLLSEWRSERSLFLKRMAREFKMTEYEIVRRGTHRLRNKKKHVHRFIRKNTDT